MFKSLHCGEVLMHSAFGIGDIWGYLVFYLIEGFINVTVNCCTNIHLLLVILDLRMVVSDFLLYYVQKNLWAKTHPVISVEQKAQS